MIVVDVLLALNLVVLVVCALRGTTERRDRAASFRADLTRPDPGGSTRDAVVIPFRPRTPEAAYRRAASLHPSRQDSLHPSLDGAFLHPSPDGASMHPSCDGASMHPSGQGTGPRGG